MPNLIEELIGKSHALLHRTSIFDAMDVDSGTDILRLADFDQGQPVYQPAVCKLLALQSLRTSTSPHAHNQLISNTLNFIALFYNPSGM